MKIDGELKIRVLNLLLKKYTRFNKTPSKQSMLKSTLKGFSSVTYLELLVNSPSKDGELFSYVNLYSENKIQ